MVLDCGPWKIVETLPDCFEEFTGLQPRFSCEMTSWPLSPFLPLIALANVDVTFQNPPWANTTWGSLVLNF